MVSFILVMFVESSHDQHEYRHSNMSTRAVSETATQNPDNNLLTDLEDGNVKNVVNFPQGKLKTKNPLQIDEKKNFLGLAESERNSN